MTDPKKDADKRRAEAQRARLAATLSQPADQDRLKQYADELERKAAKAAGQPVDKERRERSTRRACRYQRGAASRPPVT